jgi:hypothetical protein
MMIRNILILTVIAALVPTAMMTEVYASSDEDDEESDENGGGDSNDESESTVPSESLSADEESAPNMTSKINITGRTTSQLEEFISIEEELGRKFGESEDSAVNATELCEILMTRQDASPRGLIACRNVLGNSTIQR